MVTPKTMLRLLWLSIVGSFVTGMLLLIFSVKKFVARKSKNFLLGNYLIDLTVQSMLSNVKNLIV